MLIRITTFLVLFSVVVVSSTGSVLAQTSVSKDEKRALHVKSKIAKLGTGKDAKIKVKLKSKTTYEGYVSEAQDDSFVVVDKSGINHTVTYVEVDSLNGKNLPLGVKIAIGALAVFGALVLLIGIGYANSDNTF